MSIETGDFHEYEVGDFLGVQDLNDVRRTVKKLAHSLPSDGIVGHDGVVTRRRTPKSSKEKYARIVRTLQRADPTTTPETLARDYYTIELVGDEVAEWSSVASGYYVGDEVKYPPGDPDQKQYTCTKDIPANLVSSIPPTTGSHWEESQVEIDAYVFGYYDSLLSAAPWFQVDDIVKVFRYEHPDYPAREWWIDETVFKIEEGTGPNKIASLYWYQKDENDNLTKRVASVYR
jgi:hypothetical protein